jgi:AcrR family transcriptional regulator
MELYRERGFDRTTVADIAERAGLTERTFFRYFTDKREVLFWGAKQLEELLVGEVVRAPETAAPIDVVIGAFEATSSMFEERREFARVRQALIMAHPELKERELIKLVSLASAIGEALRKRGVSPTASTLAAETGGTIFKMGFERWLEDPKKRDLVHHIRASRRALRAILAGQAAHPKRTAARG